MNWAAGPHPIERLAEWLAPLVLALAGGWASHAAAMPVIGSAGLALLLLACGHWAMRVAGRVAPPSFAFEPARYAPHAHEPGELLLETKDELLELTDPLVEISADSRVVQLFARPEPTPGELVERIADYLGEGERCAAVDRQAPIAVDASDALHAALANIRATLRQGTP